MCWLEDWEGVNWLGIPVNPVRSHVEGMYLEQLKTAVLDERTADKIGYKYAGQRESYYIPFTKKKVDEVIAKSVHSDKESIRYVIKFDSAGSPESTAMKTRNYFTYEQFTEWKWDELYKYHTTRLLVIR